MQLINSILLSNSLQFEAMILTKDKVKVYKKKSKKKKRANIHTKMKKLANTILSQMMKAINLKKQLKKIAPRIQ